MDDGHEALVLYYKDLITFLRHVTPNFYNLIRQNRTAESID